MALARKLAAMGITGISLNAIAGPCTAHELGARRHTAVVFTGEDQAVLDGIRPLLRTAYYHPWTPTDAIGVEVCAAMKNAYALGVALAVGQMEAMGRDGLADAYNPQAALFGQGCLEMRRLVGILGGDPGKVSWLPGAGDLYGTVFGGRIVRLGKLLGQGMALAEERQVLSGLTLESVEITTRVARALPRLVAWAPRPRGLPAADAHRRDHQPRRADGDPVGCGRRGLVGAQISGTARLAISRRRGRPDLQAAPTVIHGSTRATPCGPPSTGAGTRPG